MSRKWDGQKQKLTWKQRTLEQVKEDKLTGKTEERELEADDEPASEVSIPNKNKEEILKEDSVVTHDEQRNGLKSPDFPK